MIPVEGVCVVGDIMESDVIVVDVCVLARKDVELSEGVTVALVAFSSADGGGVDKRLLVKRF
jgi:hypothetical protein